MILDTNALSAWAEGRTEIMAALRSAERWIAALARQHDLPVLSNDRHLDAVDGVRRIAF